MGLVGCLEIVGQGPGGDDVLDGPDPDGAVAVCGANDKAQ